MRNDSFEYKGTDKEAELQNHLEEAYLRLMMQKYMEQYGEELLEEEKNLPDGVPKQPTEAQIQQLKDKLAQAAQKYCKAAHSGGGGADRAVFGHLGERRSEVEILKFFQYG